MIAVDIQGQTYKCPEGWQEVTLSKFIEFDPILKIEGEMDLKAACVGFWFGISDELIDQMSVDNIETLYAYVHQFTQFPSDIEEVDSFKFKGVQYELSPSLKTIDGKVRPMGKATFEEWKELTSLEDLSKKAENNWQYLPLMTAIMFKPKDEKYDSEKAKKRAEVFKELPMNLVWAGYFFFERQVLSLAKTINQKVEEEKSKLHSPLPSNGKSQP